MKSHYVYILECSDGSLYTGYSTDPDRRLRQHNSGKGAKYTRARKPVRLVFKRGFPTRSEALRFESEIKKKGRAAKFKLFAGQPPG